jgi:hypothetical protein
MVSFLEYEVPPCANVPAGLPRQRLAVLSSIWRGKTLFLEYPEGAIHTLQGWSGPEPGEAADLRIFWTRHQPQGPRVCLAIGGDHGLRDLGPEGTDAAPLGYPFLALAESLIPLEVLEVIGPAPPPEKDRKIRLLA